MLRILTWMAQPAESATLSAPHVLEPAIQHAPPVQPVSTQSKESQGSASLLVLTTRPITIWMAKFASSAMESAPPAVDHSTTIVKPASIRRSSTLQLSLPSTAPQHVEMGSTLMGLTAEVSLIKTELVCASNCKTCTGGTASDCSMCDAGYFLNPTTNVCESTCPNGYY